MLLLVDASGDFSNSASIFTPQSLGHFSCSQIEIHFDQWLRVILVALQDGF